MLVMGSVAFAPALIPSTIDAVNHRYSAYRKEMGCVPFRGQNCTAMSRTRSDALRDLTVVHLAQEFDKHARYGSSHADSKPGTSAPRGAATPRHSRNAALVRPVSEVVVIVQVVAPLGLELSPNCERILAHEPAMSRTEHNFGQSYPNDNWLAVAHDQSVTLQTPSLPYCLVCHCCRYNVTVLSPADCQQPGIGRGQAHL
jgi:hypothetical protein